MRELNKREKLILYFSLPICMLLVHSIFSRNFQRSIDRQMGALEEAEQRITQVRDQIKQIPEAPKEERKTASAPVIIENQRHETSLALFREITQSQEFEGIRVVSTDKITDTSFRVVVRGEFPAMVRWLTYFERHEGRFSVQSASLSPTSAEGQATTRELSGTFEVKLKS